MHVCVIGASGRLGNLITRNLLEKNVNVHVLVRNVNKFKFQTKVNKLEIGSALDMTSIRNAMEGCEAVISVLGEKTFWKPFTVLSDSVKIQIKVMNDLNIKRWIGVGHGLILDHQEGGLIGEHGIPTILENIYADKKKEYEIVKESDLDWTIICPKYVPTGEKTGNYVMIEDYLPENGDSVSSEDVADAVVKILIENNFIKKRVGIGYPSS